MAKTTATKLFIGNAKKILHAFLLKLYSCSLVGFSAISFYYQQYSSTLKCALKKAHVKNRSRWKTI